MRGHGRWTEAAEVDETAANELDLYAENESALYGQYQSILKNLLRKMRRGTYSAELAPKLWAYWYEAAAKRYAGAFGGVWSVIFPKATRDFAARERAKDEEARLRSGEHDYLLQSPAQRKAQIEKSAAAAKEWVK